MIKLIGFTGYAGHGKDTAADFTAEWLKARGVYHYRYGLADPLKSTVNKMFGWGYEEAYGCNKEKPVKITTTIDKITDSIAPLVAPYLQDAKALALLFIEEMKKVVKDIHTYKPYDESGQGYVTMYTSPRVCYQIFGTEVIRKYVGDSFWFDLADKSMEEEGAVCLIPDIRFDNEVNWVLGHKNSSGKRNSLLIGVTSNREKRAGTTHPSEQYIDTAIARADINILNTKGLDDFRKAVHYSLERLFK